MSHATVVLLPANVVCQVRDFKAGRCECVLHCGCCCRGILHFADELQHVGECCTDNMLDIFCCWATAVTLQVLPPSLTRTFLSPSITLASESKPKFNLKRSLTQIVKFGVILW